MGCVKTRRVDWEERQRGHMHFTAHTKKTHRVEASGNGLCGQGDIQLPKQVLHLFLQLHVANTQTVHNWSEHINLVCACVCVYVCVCVCVCMCVCVCVSLKQTRESSLSPFASACSKMSLSQRLRSESLSCSMSVSVYCLNKRETRERAQADMHSTQSKAIRQRWWSLQGVRDMGGRVENGPRTGCGGRNMSMPAPSSRNQSVFVQQSQLFQRPGFTKRECVFV